MFPGFNLLYCRSDLIHHKVKIFSFGPSLFLTEPSSVLHYDRGDHKTGAVSSS